MTSQVCGRWPREIYDQLNASATHFSSFNKPVVTAKSIEYMQDVVGTRPSKWCAGCHDHAVFFNAASTGPQEADRHPGGPAGCLHSCHSIVHVKSTMGRGTSTIE